MNSINSNNSINSINNYNKNIGIFINNNNEYNDNNKIINNKKIMNEINNSNYNQLKENFDIIFFVDYEEEFKENLKNSENIIFLNNDEIHNASYFKKIKYISNYLIENISDIILRLNTSSTLELNITFINNNYIYCSPLKDYFDYLNQHKLDLCSFSDTTEINYHYELYFFTIIFDKLNILKQINEEDKNNLHKYFNNKMPYLKLGYLDSNLESNIFLNNNNLYEFLIEKNILSIISLEKLNYLRNNYKYNPYKQIPIDFDINIYRTHEDLKNFPDNFLYNHFLDFGQYESRKYNKNLSNNMHITPYYIRNKLRSVNLLKLFDIPDNFNIYKYEENNKDLNFKNKQNYILHWIDHGKDENRIYI